MDAGPKSKGNLGITIAIITGIFTIVAACIGAVATVGAVLIKQNNTTLFFTPTNSPQEATSIEGVSQQQYPTQTLPPPARATETSVPIIITPTSEPTFTPAPLPTKTKQVFSPDQKLAIGQPYFGDGYRVILNEMFVYQGGIGFYLEVYNDRSSHLVFSTYYSNAHLYDDLGNEYPNSTSSLNGSVQYDIYPDGDNQVGDWGQLHFKGTIRPEANYLIFEYKELLGLSNLTWKIPVNQ